MKKTKLRSESISEFLDFIKQTKSEYEIAKIKLSEADKLSQDLLHKLELEGKTARERNIISKELQICRKERRYYKDIIEETSDLIFFISEAPHKKTFDILSNVLGKIRKSESYHKNRNYTPRIITNKEN